MYVAPIKGSEPAGGNKIGGPVGSGDTSLISTVAWPPQCSGVLIYGLASPMRWGRWRMALSDSIRKSDLDSWLQDSPPLRLVICRWLACVAQPVSYTGKCASTLERKLHKSLLSPVVDGSQVWLDLQPSKSCNFYPSECQTCWLQTCHPSGLLIQRLHQLGQ